MWVAVSDHADMLYRGGFLLEARARRGRDRGGRSNRSSGPLGALLSVGWIRWIGQISYGLYLYHWPVFVTLDEQRTGLDGYALFAVRIAVTFAIATAVVLPRRDADPDAARSRGAGSPRSSPASRVAVLAGIFLATAGAPPAKVEVSAADVKAPAADELRFAQRRAIRTRVMLVGDSLAGSLSPGLQRLAHADRLRVLRCHRARAAG